MEGICEGQSWLGEQGDVKIEVLEGLKKVWGDGMGSEEMVWAGVGLRYCIMMMICREGGGGGGGGHGGGGDSANCSIGDGCVLVEMVGGMLQALALSTETFLQETMI